MSEDLSRILLISNDATMTYLIRRYAEQSGYELNPTSVIPLPEEVIDLGPEAILFASIERLEAAQSLINVLETSDIPVLVCSSLSDEARAWELGADRCLTQPLTYDGFLHALHF
jgi:DNA-binding response OmpR family regulator